MIKLHHLRIGRSVFAAWLFEELGLDYELEIYIRGEDMRAPPELKNIHPLGKSPVIEDDGMVIAESGAITAYVIDRYDSENKLAPPKSDIKARAAWTQWLHYSEGSAFAPLLTRMLLMRDPNPSSDFAKTFSDREVALQLSYLQNQLGDNAFILGDRLQAPDIGITFIIYLAEQLGALSEYPKLAEYMKRNMARAAFKQAMEKTGG